MSNERDLRSDEAELGAPSAEILQRIRALMAQRPEPFSNAQGNPTPDPKPGQFWTARWNELSTAVLLLGAARARTVSLAVVTFDSDLADDHARTLSSEAADLNTTAVVWVEDAQRIPLAVLDTYLGELNLAPGSDRTRAVAQFVAETGKRGLPTSRPSDTRAIFRASLRDDIDELAQASWLTAVTSSSATERVRDRSPSDLARELGISVAEALSMRRGTQVPTAEQIEAMSQLQAADTSPALMHSAELPIEIVHLFDQPSYRQKAAKLARLRELEENTARQTFAYQVASAAARKTGDDKSEEAEREFWRQRVDQFFDVQFEDWGEED